jgi:hypothetical protein
MPTFFGVSLREVALLAGIAVPTALLSVAVALWLEARSRGGSLRTRPDEQP